MTVLLIHLYVAGSLHRLWNYTASYPTRP